MRKKKEEKFCCRIFVHQIVFINIINKSLFLFRFASRTRMKVGRAFSFNKTPSKLKRAMSTMMSPFGSTHSLTPASQQLAQMRLASCNNINVSSNFYE